jgi:uncharacterized membrane protein
MRTPRRSTTLTRLAALVPGLLVMTLLLSGCRSGGGAPADPGGGPIDPGGGGGGGGGGGTVSSDRDGDGVPNELDGFPDDPARFGNYGSALLGNLSGGTFGAAVAVNGANEIVGMSDDGTSVKAVRWTVSGGSAPTLLAPLETGGYGAAYGIDDGGIAVGESQKGSAFVPVVWTSGDAAPTELSLAGMAAPASAYAVEGGRVVGEATVAGATVAVLWTSPSAAPISLGTLGGATSAAYALSDSVIVGEALDAEGAARGALWTLIAGVPGPPQALEPLPGHVASVALSVSGEAGEIVGESESEAGEIHAVLWKLNASGVAGAPLDLGIGSADAVNGAHRIAGYRGATDVPSLWDTRNLALVDPFLAGTFDLGHAYGLNDSGVVVGSTSGRPFVATPH